MHNRRSTLYAVDVAPGSGAGTVSAWWALDQRGRVYGAIATSDDGFRTEHLERGGWRAWARHRPLTKEVHPPVVRAFTGLLASPVTSLDPHTRAFVAGGDGATLLPFQAVARSTDGGGWQGQVVAEIHGDRAYVDGDLVLPDGRLLVLLDAWSSDRGPARPGPEHHGLWISDRDDWSSYAPFQPRFEPALTDSDAVDRVQAQPGPGRQDRRGLVVATTRENRVYVSGDGARTFREVRAR